MHLKKLKMKDKRVSKHNGKNEPYKARLCIRGDLIKGKEDIKSDSPTASKEAIKLALIIAANEGFQVKSGDIKSAYLQGELMDREVFVKPPKEANVKGKLWLLLKGAYGIVDGGRLFFTSNCLKSCRNLECIEYTLMVLCSPA